MYKEPMHGTVLGSPSYPILYHPACPSRVEGEGSKFHLDGWPGPVLSEAERWVDPLFPRWKGDEVAGTCHATNASGGLILSVLQRAHRQRPARTTAANSNKPVLSCNRHFSEMAV
ncbi:predicted protein [Plenodomus lingam JN3]|uniref:Predicted protein n=1 Tax=Leptosphaeria maculans (strain JN3 / isolate v23.1.3 / race Av1-4-5-6-7-8) TaxID=985895 RepID=E5A1W7_LEPMJ|nr:predicted protein [Plenodomus lingam JN3]CBX97684.1 predicted protein [Plenodomus lingam JN3]